MHRLIKRLCLVLLTLAAYLNLVSPVVALADSSIPVINPKQVIRSKPSCFELFQLDDSLTNGRQPLLLVHGLYGEHRRLFRWDRLCRHLTRNENFRQRYKIFLVRYNTQARLDDLEKQCKIALNTLSAKNPRKLVIVTLSLGGNIVRKAMEEESIAKSVERVVTLGAVFHGSPVFCSKWMEEGILKQGFWPVTKIDRYLAYKLYFKRHKNLQADYGWDNFDGKAPDFAACSTGYSSNQEMQESAAKWKRLQEKFTVYSGYLLNDKCRNKKRGFLKTLLNAPLDFMFTTLPAHFGGNHAVLRMLNEAISNLSLRNETGGKCGYLLNDGICPIASSLFLDLDCSPQHANLNDKQITKLRQSLQARKGRLFEGIDHVSFLDGHAPRRSFLIVDKLSLTEKPRSIFDWLLYDLMESN